jgi:hypothetical protein
MSKLQQLADMEGIPVLEMLEEATFDSIAPGICTRPDCDFTTEVEPDQRLGLCEYCEAHTVKSCLVIAGLI